MTTCIMCEAEIGALGYCTACDDKWSVAITQERDQLRAAINGMSEAFELEKEQARYFKNRAGYLWAVLKEIRDLARTVGNKTPRAQAPELCARIATLAEEALK